MAERAIEVNRVPQDDCGDREVEAARAVPLGLERAVADFTQSIETDRAGQVVAQFALVQDRGHAARKLRILQPVEDEQRALDTTELAQRERKAVLR